MKEFYGFFRMVRKQWLNKPAEYSCTTQSCVLGHSSDNSCARNPACTLDTASCRVTGSAPSKLIPWLPAKDNRERLGSQQRNTRLLAAIPASRRTSSLD